MRGNVLGDSEGCLRVAGSHVLSISTLSVGKAVRVVSSSRSGLRKTIYIGFGRWN